ncbi:MAG: ABC transporter ATP-binding protein [Eubacteriales bacterium]|nr:ABC transporter ATP-binding protein [Eubacteriales bacterium]
MIEIKGISKRFGTVEASNNVTLDIQDGQIFGLLGTNGAGKSTLLRMMSGVLKPDGGELLVDGQDVFDNPDVKSNIFYISDDQFYFPNVTVLDMMAFYKVYYPDFDEKRFRKFLLRFDLDSKRKVRTFSKGMKKQLSILMGICAGTKYLICDETFDGLDPVMRQGIKSLLVKEIDERGLTPIIASHNLRELEDICDHIGLLHKGGVLLSRELEDLKSNLLKVQCVLPEEADERIRFLLEVAKFERRGKLVTMIVRADADSVMSVVNSFDPVYCEAIPLSLEEIFICETEVVGYDIKNLIF